MIDFEAVSAALEHSAAEIPLNIGPALEAPLCERCGEPKNRHYTGHGGNRYWQCGRCTNEKQNERHRAVQNAKEPPICDKCGLPKTKLRAGRGHGMYWGCRPCRSRKSLEAYRARKATGESLGVVRAIEAAAERKPPEPKPEKPLSPCWREHRDLWAAEHHLRGMTLKALRAAAGERDCRAAKDTRSNHHKAEK